jgi:hypothetical protein
LSRRHFKIAGKWEEIQHRKGKKRRYNNTNKCYFTKPSNKKALQYPIFKPLSLPDFQIGDVTCLCTAFAVTFRCLPSCGIASATRAMARWKHGKRSCLPFGSVLAKKFAYHRTGAAALLPVSRP